MVLNWILQWGVMLALSGTLIGMAVTFYSMPVLKQKKFKGWVVASILLIAIGTMTQLMYLIVIAKG